jgi:ribosomal-protein-alanine N-acetyltransferase
MRLRPAAASDAEALTRLHAASFESGWSADALVEAMTGAGAFALVVEGDGGLDGFIIAREAGGEAEILTLAVDPERRRRGLGAQLAAAAIEAALARGASALFLEVAVDNAAAIGLYRSLGFSEAGRRPRYYARRDGSVDALILRRDLTP